MTTGQTPPRVAMPLNYTAPIRMNGGSLLTCRGVLIGSALDYVRARPAVLPSADVVGDLNQRAQRRLLGPRISAYHSMLDRVMNHVVRPFISFC